MHARAFCVATWKASSGVHGKSFACKAPRLRLLLLLLLLLAAGRGGALLRMEWAGESMGGEGIIWAAG